MKWLTILLVASLIGTFSTISDASVSGYTYRVMERRRATLIKKWQEEQVNSESYKVWEKGFIKRMRCMNVPANTTNQQLQAYCFSQQSPTGGATQQSTQPQAGQ